MLTRRSASAKLRNYSDYIAKTDKKVAFSCTNMPLRAYLRIMGSVLLIIFQIK